MNKPDYSLLYLKSETARARLRELARTLRKSPQRVKYNVDMLEKEGILKNPFCLFDYSYFGLILFRVYFRGGYLGEKDKERTIKTLSGNPYVLSVYELNGEYDFVVEFAAPNPSKFNKEFKNLISVSNTLSNYKIVLNLVTHVFTREYFLNDKTFTSISYEKIIGGDRKEDVFKPVELKVIKCLLINPLASLTKISSDADVNIKTANSILKDLAKRNIIRGYKYLLDANKLNIYRYRLFLKLHNLSLEKENQLVDYIVRVKEIVQMNKTVGDWDIEIDLESLDNNRIRYLIANLREEFKEIIQQFNLIEFFDYYKKSYLPMYLFN